MNTIELSREVARKFVTTQYPEVAHVPFDEFAIVFPATALSSDEQIKKFSSISKKAMDKMKNTMYTAIYTTVSESYATVLLNDENGIVLSVEITPQGVKILKGMGEKVDYAFLTVCLDVFKGVCYQLSLPVVEKEVDEVREKKSQSVANIPSSSKKYIYRTRYRFKSIAEPIQRKPTTRKTSCWGVMGHIRRFRDENGNVIKETWVKPYTKGNGTPKENTYKITRI